MKALELLVKNEARRGHKRKRRQSRGSAAESGNSDESSDDQIRGPKDHEKTIYYQTN